MFFSYFKLENFESCLQFYSQELDLNLLSVAGYSPFFFYNNKKSELQSTEMIHETSEVNLANGA